MFFIGLLYGENGEFDYTKLRIMDGAIGYGQRLMTALVLKCNYIGCDPNTETIQGCRQMIKDLATVATLLQAHPPGWAFECLGPNVQLELEPTRGGLIIQSERYHGEVIWRLSRILP